MTSSAPTTKRGLVTRLAGPLAALAGAVLLSSMPVAQAATAFKAVDHNWVVALNQATVHNVPPGGTFGYCATQHVSAITPSVTYSGAPVGKAYTEKVIGPPAAGSIIITAMTNVDGHRSALRFAKATGTWDNTYAVLSFTGTEHGTTLPPGRYSFEVVLAGKVIAKTTVHLAAKAGC